MRWSYAFGHWILTLLLAPLTSQAIEYIVGKNPHQVVGLLEVYPISLLFSLIFSLPTLGIYLLCFYFLKRRQVHPIKSKASLIAISVTGLVITISLMKGSMSQDIVIAYSITLLIVGIILKLRTANSAKGY